MEHAIKIYSDNDILEIIWDIVRNNPDKVEAIKAKPTLVGWVVGQVMKETHGKANPKNVENMCNFIWNLSIKTPSKGFGEIISQPPVTGQTKCKLKDFK